MTLSLSSCTAIFSESETKVIDAGFPGIIDAKAQLPCALSTPLSIGSGVRLVGAQVMDVNQDEQDELFLIAENDGDSAVVFIHDGSCLVTRPFDYQAMWSPDGQTGGGSFVAKALSFVPSRNTLNQIAVLAEQDQEVLLSTYEVVGTNVGAPEVASAPSFIEAMSDYPNGPEGASSCKAPEPPYHLRTADMNDDNDEIKDDLIFAAGQGWVYRVASWSSPPGWDRACTGEGVLSGAIPDKHSGSGTRLGYMPVPLGGLLGDEMLSARRAQVDWIYDYGSRGQLTPWPGAEDIIGAAVSRSATVEDGNFYMVGWDGSSPLNLYAVRLTSGDNHTVDFDPFTLNIGNSRPTAGVVLGVMGKQRLLLLVDSTLYLIDPNTPVTPVVSQADFDFTPSFFVTPNWGTDDQPIVLTFDSDTGDYLCHSFTTTGELVLCGS